MSKEIKRVPPGWQHPKNSLRYYYESLIDSSYKQALLRFETLIEEKGIEEAEKECGKLPDPKSYMPEWMEEERTHYQMYEVDRYNHAMPVSPIFSTPEQVARFMVIKYAYPLELKAAAYLYWLLFCSGERISSSGPAFDEYIKSVDF